jgi:DNA-binding NarL/FixJ family response regulator
MHMAEVESPVRPVVLVLQAGLVADAVAAAVGVEPDLDVVGVADTMRDGCRLAAELHPDIVVTDYALPDGTGPAATEIIRADSPNTHVVIMSDRPRADMLAQAIESGCSAFVAKDQSLGDLLAAMRSAAEGELVVPHDVLQSGSPLSARQRHAYADLTPREHEVLMLIAQGRSTSEIVDELVISVHTARNHIRSILQKLGVHSRVEAVAIALRLGDLPVPR